MNHPPHPHEIEESTTPETQIDRLHFVSMESFDVSALSLEVVYAT